MNIDAQLYLNLIRGGAAKLAQERQTINELNVFPIPDGDTGDNMYMTIEAGSQMQGSTLSQAADEVSRGMLLGARGNSGVILSRIFAGIAKGFQGLQQADMGQFTQAMQCAVKEAYSAVAQPVEGTILTVLREGVDAAGNAPTLETFFDQWIAAMEQSLQHTPELLDVLKKAGVVDSGGAGLLCIAEGMRAALHGESIATMESPNAPQAHQTVDFNAFTQDSILEFGYCTEFLLRLQSSKVNLDSFDESIIKDWLESIGDSLVFFRDGSIIKVHVHTMDPGAVLSKCRQWGEFLTIKIENMTLQHHENHMDQRFKRARKPLGVVTVAAGKGLADTFRQMGADAVIEGGQTMNPPVERFLDAFKEIGADHILVFPNNSNIILTAKQAAEIYADAHVEVIPTKTLGEGYYALANLDADEAPETLVQSLTEAAASVTTGLVSRAIRDAEGVKEGDYVGITGKDILCSGASAEEAAEMLSEKLDAGSADVLLLMAGQDAKAPQALQETLQKKYPMAEVILLQGDQPVYDYIIVLC